jgi:Ni/Fe-hydrogenase 1 B-type cytochrome subunit
MKEVKRKEYYLFSPFLRIFHWIMVAMITVLFITGIIIATPLEQVNVEPAASMTYIDFVRDIHFVAAFVFMASFILRIYGFIINRGDRLFPHFWKGYFYSQTIDVALHYMLIKPAHASYLRNPLARMSYLVLYVLVAVEVLTGFAMYDMVNPNGFMGMAFGWVNTVLGGEMTTHLVHHYAAWFIILFAIGHIYMVIRSEFMEGESEVSSMFSGSKLLAHHPLDAGDVDIEKSEKGQRAYFDDWIELKKRIDKKYGRHVKPEQ